jgi:GH25 family lysozyme M1 (1,4-beta-N-acetylmuramidase)
MKRKLLFRVSYLVAATLAAGVVFGPTRALGQRALGVDVSSYQGSPNWTAVKNAGIAFAWAKATEGANINDSSFAYNENNGKAAGVYMGAYHFARPNLNSPGTEANHFWAVAGPYIKNDGKTLMPVLDFEVFSGVVGASSYSDWANQWCNAIVSKAAAAGVAVQPVLYTSACSACNFNSSVARWFSWIADYNGQNPQSGTPWSVCGDCGVWGAGSWTAWQYGSAGSVSGISGGCDVDVFHGSTSGLVSTLVIGSQDLTFAPGPNAVSWGANRIDVVCRGGGNNIYHKYWDGSAWQPNGYFDNLGGVAISGAGICSWGSGRLDVFTTGTDSTLQHRYYDGSWNPLGNWEDMGGALTSTPSAVSWGANRIDVVVRGGGNNIYHKYFDGSAWQPNGYFENLGGTAKGPPGICSWGAGRLDVFIRGNDDALWHAYYTGGNWSSWQSLGGTLTSGPAAVAWGSGRIDVVVRGGNNHVYHKYYISGQGWLPNGYFEDLGGNATSDPGISAWGSGRLDVFCRGADNSLQHTYYQGSGNWSAWQSLGGTLQ